MTTMSERIKGKTGEILSLCQRVTEKSRENT
nr:MAG TPA: hypothetical protein [Caudoviricetes sp.]